MTYSIQDTMDKMITASGQSVGSLSKQQPLMIGFLRHFGCIFCMEAMKDIALVREEIEKRNVKIILVHMSEPEVAEGYFKDYNLIGIDHVSDPECKFYEDFGLVKGKMSQLFGLKVWLRTAQLAAKDITQLKRNQVGDGLQMPGVFVVKDGEVSVKYVHRSASDRPDYDDLTSCCKIS